MHHHGKGNRRTFRSAKGTRHPKNVKCSYEHYLAVSIARIADQNSHNRPAAYSPDYI